MLPAHLDLFYGGAWHAPKSDRYVDTISPGTGESLGKVADDQLGGFSINGKGFPATSPLTAKKGQKLRIRYMNEGQMIHPMHLHGLPQLVFAKERDENGRLVSKGGFTIDYADSTIAIRL